MFLLDTNVCIRFLQGRSSSLLQKFNSVPTDEKCLCSVVAGELLYGAAKSLRKQETLNQLLPFMSCFRMFDFDLAAAHQFGEIRTELERIGRPIGPFDLQIAAIARANHLIVVTHNSAEFSRVPGLPCVDWESEFGT